MCPPPDNNSIDVTLALSKMHDCLTDDLATSASAFFIAHGMDVDDLSLDGSDPISHLMNGYCANHTTPACTEISQGIRLPVKMAIVVSETVIDRYTRNQMSLEHLSVVCSAVGIHSGGRQPESLNLIQKLKQ